MANSVMKAERVRGDKSSPVVISLSGTGIEISEGWKAQNSYAWSDISELEVEGPDAIQKRITASRLLMTGVFAFAFKKKTGEAFAFIGFKDNREAIVLKFPKKSEPEVKAFFASYKSRISADAAVESIMPVDNSVEQLTKLGELFEKGLIDEAEFKASKAKILGIS